MIFGKFAFVQMCTLFRPFLFASSVEIQALLCALVVVNFDVINFRSEWYIEIPSNVAMATISREKLLFKWNLCFAELLVRLNKQRRLISHDESESCRRQLRVVFMARKIFSLYVTSIVARQVVRYTSTNGLFVKDFISLTGFLLTIRPVGNNETRANSYNLQRYEYQESFNFSTLITRFHNIQIT